MLGDILGAKTSKPDYVFGLESEAEAVIDITEDTQVEVCGMQVHADKIRSERGVGPSASDA